MIVNECDEAGVRMILKKSGMIHYRLLRFDGKTTFLVFHKTQLASYLENIKVLRILEATGYHDLSLGGILRTFQCRYEAHFKSNLVDGEEHRTNSFVPCCHPQEISSCKETLKQAGPFPHEMGLLLGYPVEDVEGFIKHCGKNYLYSGYWKVYKDVEEKKKIFEAYENAKEQMILFLAQGYKMRSIIQMCQR